MRMISVHGNIKAQADKITAGLEVENTESCRIKITGINCTACVETIESTLSATPGLKEVKISQVLSQALIKYAPKYVLVEEIVSKIEDLGYGAERMIAARDWAADIKEADEQRALYIVEWKTSLYCSSAITTLIVAMGLFPASMGFYLDPQIRLRIEAVLCAVVIAVFGRQFHYEAFLAFQGRRFDMSLLTSFGTILSFIGSLCGVGTPDYINVTSFESTAILSCVTIGGRLLKSIVVRQSVSSLSSLTALMPEMAEVLTGNFKEEGTVTIAIDKLQIGDHVVVSPGDIIPIDGKIVDGCGNITEIHVTGEILPVLKSKGSHVFAGSTNHDVHLIIEVTRTGQLTWLQHTLQLMADGDIKKGSTQGLADFLAARFVLFILAIAIFTFAKTYWFEAAPWLKAFHRVTAIVLCACPCLASRKGILVKGGSQSIEAAARTRTILFDNTGTLTTGELSIIRAEQAPYWETSITLKLGWWSALLAIEQRSKHPIARAIASEARQQLEQLRRKSACSNGMMESVEVVSFINVLGLGVICDIRLPLALDKSRRVLHVLIGSRRFLKSNGVNDIPIIEIEDSQYRPSKNEPNYSNIMDTFIAFDGVYAGWIRSADEVRTEAAETVQLLRSRGYRIGMMTGGTASAAHSVARAVGIHPDWVYSGLLPKEKLRIITKVRAQHGPVSMIGDNLNDVQSMTAADFSIAAFVDINSLTAITADAILLADSTPPSYSDVLTGLLKVPYIFELTNKIYNKIWQNLLWAIVYNSLAVVVGTGAFENFGIILSPLVPPADLFDLIHLKFGWMLTRAAERFYAGLGMSLSSVFVITNAMNLGATQS
ncbi:hypothetical protein B7463_g11443, partial [Scytalidium lignicola]